MREKLDSWDPSPGPNTLEMGRKVGIGRAELEMSREMEQGVDVYLRRHLLRWKGFKYHRSGKSNNQQRTLKGVWPCRILSSLAEWDQSTIWRLSGVNCQTGRMKEGGYARVIGIMLIGCE
jgi:hypothetical protein